MKSNTIQVKRCMNCDHSNIVSTTHVFCDKKNKNVMKLDYCSRHKKRSLDKDIID